MVGMVTGIIRMVLDFIYTEPTCGEIDLRPGIVKNVKLLNHFFIRFNLYNTCFIIASLFIFCHNVILSYWVNNDYN